MKKLKVMTVVGTRPEIIRLSRVIARLDEYCEHVLVHTGQNYDYELNQIFFEDLEIRKPDYFLGAAGGTAGETIGPSSPRSTRRCARSGRTRFWSWATPTLAWPPFPPSGRRSPSSTWRRATAVTTTACPRRSTGA